MIAKQLKTEMNENQRCGNLEQFPLEIRKVWHQMLLPHKEVLEDPTVSNVEQTLLNGKHSIHVVIDKDGFFIIWKLTELSLSGEHETRTMMIRLNKKDWEENLLQEGNTSNIMKYKNGDASIVFADKSDIDKELSKLNLDKEMHQIDRLLDVRNLVNQKDSESN